MKNCLDDEALQSFFDRELPSAVMEDVARHLASCASCAQAASEVEQESIDESETSRDEELRILQCIEVQ